MLRGGLSSADGNIVSFTGPFRPAAGLIFQFSNSSWKVYWTLWKCFIAGRCISAFLVALARYKTSSRRLKNFNISSTSFRHELSPHGICFHAVLFRVFLSVKYDQPLFVLDEMRQIIFSSYYSRLVYARDFLDFKFRIYGIHRDQNLHGVHRFIKQR